MPADSVSTYILDLGEALFAVEILLRLADLFDGGTEEETEPHRLSMQQMQLMSKPRARYNMAPAQTADRLREVAARIEGQLPGDAPRIEH